MVVRIISELGRENLRIRKDAKIITALKKVGIKAYERQGELNPGWVVLVNGSYAPLRERIAEYATSDRVSITAIEIHPNVV